VHPPAPISGTSEPSMEGVEIEEPLVLDRRHDQAFRAPLG
jgi:hypothetical protein